MQSASFESRFIIALGTVARVAALHEHRTDVRLEEVNVRGCRLPAENENGEDQLYSATRVLGGVCTSLSSGNAPPPEELCQPNEQLSFLQLPATYPLPTRTGDRRGRVVFGLEALDRVSIGVEEAAHDWKR